MTPCARVRCCVTLFAIAAAELLAGVAWPERARAQTLPGLYDQHNALRAGRDSSWVEMRLGAEHSDNVLEIGHDQRSGTIYVGTLSLDVNHDGRRLDYFAVGDLNWLQYPSNTFESKLLGYFNGSAGFDVVPERFVWRVQDTYGQQIVDPFVASTPDNLATVNYLTTGPVLSVPLALATRLDLSGGYSQTTRQAVAIEETRFSGADDTRYSGAASLVHNLTPRNTIALNVSRERVIFERSLQGANYAQDQATVSYESLGARTVLSAEVGYASLDMEDRKSNGLLTRVDLRRRISGSTTLGGYVSKQFSDAGDIFRLQVGQTGGSAPLPLASASPFEDRTVGAALSFERGRTSLGFNTSRSAQRYTSDRLSDHNVTQAEATLQRRMSPRLSLRLEARVLNEKYLNLALDTRYTSALAGLEWHVSPHLGLAFRYNWFDRGSSTLVAGYTERRIGIALFFRPMGPDRP